MNKNNKKPKKHVFRALRGKDANKFYVFKDEGRRKRFSTIDKILKAIYTIAFFVFIISLWLVALGFMLFIISFVLIFGFFMDMADNPGIRLMNWSFQFLPWALGIFVVVYLLKFILEYVFLLREMKSHKKDREENKKYIDVGRAVMRSKLFGLLALIVAIVVLGVVSYFIVEVGDDLDFLHFILLGIVVLVFIIDKVVSTRLFLRVQSQIEEIKVERSVGPQVIETTGAEIIEPTA